MGTRPISRRYVQPGGARRGGRAASLGTTQTLLSDPIGLAASACGVAAGGGKYAERVTFYIDREGMTRFVDKDVDVATAGEGIADRLAKLGFAKSSD